MATLVYGMNVSLDGHVDHDRFAPGPGLFRHWIDQVRGLSASLYGRRLYEIMRYWDEDDAAWTAPERDFAEAWRAHPKWVASRRLHEVDPNATLVRDAEGAARELKAGLPGEVAVGGTVLARSLAGLVDEVRLYLHPVVLGAGTPFLAGAWPPLRLMGQDDMGEGVARLRYGRA